MLKMKMSGTVRISLFTGLMSLCHPFLQLLEETSHPRYSMILPFNSHASMFTFW